MKRQIDKIKLSPGGGVFDGLLVKNANGFFERFATHELRIEKEQLMPPLPDCSSIPGVSLRVVRTLSGRPMKKAFTIPIKDIPDVAESLMKFYNEEQNKKD